MAWPLIKYIVIGSDRTRIVRISAKALKKLIQREVREGVKVAEILLSKRREAS